MKERDLAKCCSGVVGVLRHYSETGWLGTVAPPFFLGGKAYVRIQG